MAYATIPAGTQLRLYGGLTSPYTRTLVVDKGGLGDHTTIQAAVDDAVAAGANAADLWTVQVGPGVFTENVEVHPYVAVVGSARAMTIIEGQMTQHAGSHTSNLFVYPTSLQTWGVHLIGSTSSIRGTLVNVHVHVETSAVNGLLIGVKTSGTGTTAFQAFACSVQVENKSSGGSADIHIFDLSGSNVYIDWGAGGQLKTNANLLVARNPVAVWNRATGTSYVRFDGVCWYAAKALTVRRLNSTNPNHPGATGNLPIDHDGYAPTELPDISAMSGFPRTLLYSQQALSMFVERQVQIVEMASPPAAVANAANIYAIDDGTGATRLAVRFSTGPDKVLALEGPAGGYVAGEYYGSDGAAAVTGTVAQSQTVARMCRVRVEAPSAAFSSIAVEVTTAAAAGTLLRFAIYKDDGYGRPGLLALDCGTIASDVLGLREKAITVTLTQGDYWLAVVSVNASTSIRTFTGSDRRIPQPKTGTLSASHVGYTQNHTAGAAFPSTGSINLPPVTSAPRIMLMAA